MTEVAAPAKGANRRRASRAAGPPGVAVCEPIAVPADAAVKAAVRPARLVGPPPRRRPNAGWVGRLAAVLGVVGIGGLAVAVGFLFVDVRDGSAAQGRQQRFVDAASQTVVNMFSYNQDNIDDSVNRFVNGTSGPLRDMLSKNNNAENLKAIFRDTHASSEAVINGVALEKIDEDTKNGSVLVSVRVTVTDVDGVNKPSQPYRIRVIVHEDDNGHLTAYDLRYPEGGN
jgi:Mce-associated membrane protein